MHPTMGFENMCIACLATEVKMYSLNEPSIIAYTNLTGITCIDNSDKLCIECMFVLSKVERFRLNCLRAYETLTSSEHSLDNITRNHEPKLMLTEPIVLYVGPDHIELSDSDDNDFEEAKLFNSHTHKDLKYLIQKHDIQSDAGNDTKVRTCNQGLDFDSKKIHISSLEVKQGAIIIDPCIRESKIEINSAFSDSDIDDFTHYDIITPETRNIEDKIKHHQTNEKSRSGSKVGKSKPTVKEQLKVSKKNKLIRNDRNKNIRKIMIITALSPEDAKKEIEMRKQSRSYINNTLKCDLCFKAFNYQRTLNNHMKKHNNDFGYECDYCHIRMKTRINISGHIFGSHMYKFTCRKCSYVCFGSTQAYSHTREHTGETLACKICNKAFRHTNSLARHMRVSHFSQLDETVCAICGDVFVSKLGLNSHVNLSHPQESNSGAGPACSECDVHFSSHTAYRRHLVLSKKHTVCNGCSVCGETFSDEFALKTHLRKTHPERAVRNPSLAMSGVWPAPCPECSVLLKDRKEYRLHMPAVHPSSARAKMIRHNNKKTRGNNYVCEVCGLRFKLQCLLSDHMTRHTGQRPHSCGECAETFSSRQQLSCHRARRHQPRKVCPDCGKTFADYHTLRKHRRTVHLKILPYSCSQCDRKFYNPCQLRNHLRHTHEKVPWPIPNRKTKRTAVKKHAAGKRSVRQRDYSEDSDSST